MKKTTKKDQMKKAEIMKQIEAIELQKQQKKNEDPNADVKKESLLIDEFEQQLSSNEPIRELFTPRNIKFKTELTEEQRGAVSILYHAYQLCEQYGIDFSGLKFVLDQYIDFGVSVGRKGREEFVTAHQSINQQQQQQQPMGVQGQMSQMKM